MKMIVPFKKPYPLTLLLFLCVFLTFLLASCSLISSFEEIQSPIVTEENLDEGVDIAPRITDPPGDTGDTSTDAETLPPPFIIDGNLEEWADREPDYTDAAGDAGESGIDFGEVRLAHDETYFYIIVDVGQTVSLQNDSDIYIYLDTDNDPNTGEAINGIGADLWWDFSGRRGRYYYGGDVVGIKQQDIRVVSEPTVTADSFEIAFRRDALPDGTHAAFLGDTVQLAFQDAGPGGDTAPDRGDVIPYTFAAETALAAPEEISLDKNNPNTLRIVTYNVLRDGVVKGLREDHFQRIITALDPDIINFQEMYTFSEDRIKVRLDEWLPVEGGEWHGVKVGDMVTMSRFPIVEDWPNKRQPLSGAFGAALIQIDEDNQLIIFNAHLACCDKDTDRQHQADSFAAFVRDLQTPGEGVQVPENTPFILLGDLNLVGDAAQLLTLMTGDISDTGQFGTAELPDWDSTPLADLVSRHTHSRMGYTWRDDGSSFAPGRLDFMIYTDSLLSVEKSFILFTGDMPDEVLTQFGLLREDSQEASDHLPLVADYLFIK